MSEHWHVRLSANPQDDSLIVRNGEDITDSVRSITVHAETQGVTTVTVEFMAADVNLGVEE